MSAGIARNGTIFRRIAKTVIAGAFLAASLARCSGGEPDGTVDGGSVGDAGTGTPLTIVAGGLALPFTDANGVAELKATPTFSAAEVGPDATITVSVPVDTDTHAMWIGVHFLGARDPLGPGPSENFVSTPVIEDGLATATIVLLHQVTPEGFYTVEVGAIGPSQNGNGPENQSYGTRDATRTYAWNHENQTGDTNVAYPTFRVTGTSTAGISAAAPILLPLGATTPGVTFNANGYGGTHYRLAGTAAGKLYRVGAVSTNAIFTTQGCTVIGAGGNCVLLAPAEGIAFLIQPQGAVGTVGRFTLSTSIAYDPGSVESPVDVPFNAPLTGGAAATLTSRYAAPVTNGSDYQVSIWRADLLTPTATLGQVKLRCFDNDASFTTASMTVTGPVFATLVSCVKSPAAGAAAYFSVEAPSGNGNEYRILVHAPVYACDGSPETPASIPYDTPTPGQLSGASAAYYATAVTGTSGVLTLSAVRNKAPLAVQFESPKGYFRGTCAVDPADGATSWSCPFKDITDTLFFSVDSPVHVGNAYSLRVK